MEEFLSIDSVAKSSGWILKRGSERILGGILKRIFGGMLEKNSSGVIGAILGEFFRRILVKISRRDNFRCTFQRVFKGTFGWFTRRIHGGNTGAISIIANLEEISEGNFGGTFEKMFRETSELILKKSL